MIDLSREELVPLRTLAKRRDGKVAVFIETDGSSSGMRFRFCAEGTGGTWRVSANGMDRRSEQNPHDIISIARKWKPRNGERVSVLGFGETDGFEEGEGMQPSMDLTSAHCIINDRDIETANVIRVKNEDDETNYLVARCQLRRYVAPAATAESSGNPEAASEEPSAG